LERERHHKRQYHAMTYDTTVTNMGGMIMMIKAVAGDMD